MTMTQADDDDYGSLVIKSGACCFKNTGCRSILRSNAHPHATDVGMDVGMDVSCHLVEENPLPLPGAHDVSAVPTDTADVGVQQW